MYSPPAKIVWVPAIVGGIVSVGILRTGLLGFLFLVPLGILAYCYNGKTVWFSALFACLGNFFLSLALVLFFRYSLGQFREDIFYMTLMTLVFTWIAAPPSGGPRFLRLPGVVRLAIGSALSVLTIAPALGAAWKSSAVYDFLRTQAEMLASLYAASSGADVVERSLSEQYLTPERIMDSLRIAAIRGGALVSYMFLFIINRQVSLFIAWIARRRRPRNDITGFHAPPWFIWLMSFSLLGILLGFRVKQAFLEIPAWNILVVCVIVYLAQGGGILFHLLSRARLHPVMRFLLYFFLCMILFSPRINAVFLGGVTLLGIAENWVPFRAPKPNGPSSTPGM
jgi:hypothetical protein